MTTGNELNNQAFNRATREYKNNKLRIVVMAAGLLMIFGAMLFIRGYFHGVTMAIVGMIIFGVATILKGRQIKKRVEILKAYYIQHGQFPK